MLNLSTAILLPRSDTARVLLGSPNDIVEEGVLAAEEEEEEDEEEEEEEDEAVE